MILSECAIKNQEVVAAEFERRRRIGLLPRDSDEIGQIKEYIENVNFIAPEISCLIDKLITDKKWQKLPKLITCIPVVGFGDQETETALNTVKQLAKDRTVVDGDSGILILVNRPKNQIPDKTTQKLCGFVQSKNLNAIILDTEIDGYLGSTDGPFSDEMATETNQVPIALLRDLLFLAAMKTWLNQADINASTQIPVLLQMDGDFQGLKTNSLEEIIRRMTKDKNVSFLQCNSDWESQENPTSRFSLLKLGSDLMLELPLIIKKPLNKPNLSSDTRTQIIFGETIQRGIQAPQAERMSAVAKKGGYGLTRMREDELDLNIRISACSNGIKKVGYDPTVFLWSNRRAVLSWVNNQTPPISQWINSFEANDPARTLGQVANDPNETVPNAEWVVVNKTLSRFPLLQELPDVYTDFRKPLLEIVRRYIKINGRGVEVKTTKNNLKILEFKV